MTGYQTAEQTAAPHQYPAGIPATPHLAYLGLLLALLAGDVATTVWFTHLGLPEANPLLAPIAGDVAAQVAYKAPFALLLIAGTALLAASCDRLRPGAGKYPWLAVAGIYAVPVAWNLVVIAGHTGFHVVPAVVYALVAVVCAVGVWCAARPRPEALTMPHTPPAPPLPAPRLRRPAPRRLLVVVALAVLLIAAAAPVVSAAYQTELIEEQETRSLVYEGGGTGTFSASHEPKTIIFPNLALMQSTRPGAALIFWPSGGLQISNPNIYSADIPCTLKQSGGPQCNGTIGYYKDRDGANSYLYVIVGDDWPTTGLSSSTYWYVSYNSSGLNNLKLRHAYKPVGGPGPRYRASTNGMDTEASGEYTWNSPIQFRQIVTVDGNAGDTTAMTISRVVDGAIYQSNVTVIGQNKVTPYVTGVGSANISLVLPGIDQGYKLIITPVSMSKTIERRYFWHDPPAPDNAAVTVYVQSSQTGALLANAHLSILAAAGGTETEVVNATLPGGTGTYSLEKADYLKYHATATAPGYTLLSPILFGVPEGGTTIILWMAPDAPPDVPTEPEKSMLYGYVQTQGSQQPISGATVSLDDYGSTTTSSTGFYLFNNVTPGAYTISASAPLHDALSEPVTVETVATPYNLALKGHFLLTVSAKDADDLTTLHNTTISLSDGQESTQNPATFTVDYGPYTITAAAGGYYPQTQSAYLDRPGTTTATVLLTERPPPATPAEMPNYPQHNVRFLCVDEYNHPLQNVTITAVYQESSGPVSWITDWLGLSQNVHVANSTLQGTTGLDGSVIFLMVQSVQYRMTVAAPDLNMTKTFDLYPKEDQITIRFVTSPGPDLSTMPAYDLTATETDPSSVRLALTYNDTTNATTHLSFQVYDHATGELIHSQTFAASSFPGTVSPTYDVSNTKGAMYRFGFEATNTAHGTISQYKGISLKGDNLLVDLGFEDRSLYNWLAVILLFLFAGAFSGTNVKQGAILVPLFGGGLFWFIGWLPITIGGIISAIGFLGVLVYMRKSEWKVRA